MDTEWWWIYIKGYPRRQRSQWALNEPTPPQPHGLFTHEPIYFLACKCKKKYGIDPSEVELIPVLPEEM